MSLGFSDAGVDVVGAVDASAINVDTHAANHPDCRTIQGDLATLDGLELRRRLGITPRTPLDILFGGPPCQGFSIGGKRLKSDPRNALLLHFARLVTELEPQYFVVENVKGLLRFKDVLAQFENVIADAGYEIVKPIKCLNSLAYGVPQRRERVFILGYIKGLNPPVYPEPLAGAPPTVWDAIGDLAIVDKHGRYHDGDVYFGDLGAPSKYARTLRSRTEVPLSGFAPTLHADAVTKRFAKVRPGKAERVSRFIRLRKNGVSSTLRSGTGPENGSFMAPRPIHPVYNRCIVVREAARLHSFPDRFIFHPTKWQAFMQIGNSVPPLLARTIAAEVNRAWQSNGKRL